MDEEEIDVVNYDATSTFPAEVKHEFQCSSCDWFGRSERSLNAHIKHKHPPTGGVEEVPKRTRTVRQRKKIEPAYEPGHEEDVFQERVTTKQLLGGRKRPKTVVDSIDESALRTDREASRLHELGIIDEETSLGDYVRHGGNYLMMPQEIDNEANSMVVGSEVVIGEEQEGIDDMEMFQKYSRKTKRRFPEKLPDRLTVGDANGKYMCYIPSCEWKGGYRSLRMDHMKAIHPDWKMPSRFILERISKDGVYLDPDQYQPPFACPVRGCEWRGNYRASRSTHMRKVHPVEYADKKRGAPGYNCTGHYSCHFPLCTWRGWSRSTRSTHMKKAHPDWRPEDTRALMQVSCFYCKTTFSSYDQLCTHITSHGGLGLHVDEVFPSKAHFLEWLQRVEKIYSIVFERNELTHPEEQVNEPKNYILHCNCTGQRGVDLSADSRNYVYQKHNYLKRRAIQLVTRNRNDCSVHLEIREDLRYGPLRVKGCLEHTGHRFGTPLLRLNSMDRQFYSDVMEWKSRTEFQLRAVDVVTKLNDYEGFQMDNYSAVEPSGLIEPLSTNALDSLRQILEQSDPSCFFGVEFSDQEEGNVSFGYITEDMQKLYKTFGPKKTVIIDNVLVEFPEREFTQYTVLVTDEANIPRCAMFYLTTDSDNGPAAIMQQMASLDPQGPREILTDVSEVWVDLAVNFFKEDPPQILISEWHLMDYWACKMEEYVENEYDVFCVVAALRRFLRVDELHQMQAFIVELFETFYECEYEDAAEFMDFQLTDPDFVKRWSPLLRTSFTSHAHPTTSVAARTLREMYLSNEGIERVDVWFPHITKRIQDFNTVNVTQTYTLRPLDPPRKFFYNQIATDENGEQQDLGPPHPEEYQSVMYEEDILAGEVVEEEIIGHEITEQIGEEGGEEEEVEMEEVVEEMEVTLQEGEEIIYEEIEEHQEILDVHHLQIQNQGYEEGSSGQPASGQGRPPPKIPPHRLHMYQRKPLPGASEAQNNAPRIALPMRSTRETTKAVIRSKRKSERFAQLRECPPEVMRAIAAHAISYDGRKKEQRPYMYTPSEARMATSTTPALSTPDLKPFGAVTTKKLNPQQMAVIQQQRRMKKDQWSRNMETSLSSEADGYSQPATYSEEPIYNPDDFAPASMVVHHEEVQDNEPEDDQQPCTSASMYR